MIPLQLFANLCLPTAPHGMHLPITMFMTLNSEYFGTPLIESEQGKKIQRVSDGATRNVMHFCKPFRPAQNQLDLQ